MITTLKKLSLFSSFFLFFHFSSYCQLDSAFLNAYFETIEVQVDGKDPLSIKVIRTETWVNDFDFFGEIIVTAYDEQTGNPVDKAKHTLQSVIDNNLYHSGVIQIDLYRGIDNGRSYRIEAVVRNYQGLNLPIVSKTL